MVEEESRGKLRDGMSNGPDKYYVGHSIFGHTGLFKDDFGEFSVTGCPLLKGTAHPPLAPMWPLVAKEAREKTSDQSLTPTEVNAMLDKLVKKNGLKVKIVPPDPPTAQTQSAVDTRQDVTVISVAPPVVPLGDTNANTSTNDLPQTRCQSWGSAQQSGERPVQNSVVESEEVKSVVGRPLRELRSGEGVREDPDFTLHIDCPHCKSRFYGWNTFTSHCEAVHTCQPQFKCVCGDTITKAYTYAKHKRNHRKVNVCTVCNKTYGTPESLKIHQAFHYGVQYPCPKCGKVLATRVSLKQHLDSHIPPELRQTPCHICHKLFTSRGGLYIHVRMQHKLLPEEKTHICELCGKVFCTKGNLKVHLETIHRDQKDFPCEVCGKRFARRNFLKKHKTSHLQPSIPCSLCPLMFKTEDRLRRHLKSHSDLRPYVCAICGKSFKTSVLLKHHNYLHTGEVPYSCPFCDKAFRSNGNLVKHKKRVHKREVMFKREEERRQMLAARMAV